MKSKQRISTRRVPPPKRCFLASRRSAFVFVACLGIWLPRAQAATLVNLDATGLAEGPLNTWTNTGTVLGDFVVPTTPTNAAVPSVVTTNGVKGVSFLTPGGAAGGTQYVGPDAPPEITGFGSRTIEAWVYNPNGQGEEVVFAWGRRGGTPDGSNMSFGHGTDAGFGANGIWGAPDIGWNGRFVLNRWTYIAYTYDSFSFDSTVYMDGELANRETPINLQTHSVDTNGVPLRFRVQRQNNQNGSADGTGVGQITIAKIRVHDTALDAAAIKVQFDGEKAQMWIDTDSDGVPDWFENLYTPTLNPAVADGTLDPDGDGLTNVQEYQAVFSTTPGAVWRPNPTVADTDGDGANDGLEVNRTAGTPPVAAPTNPLLRDTDGDGLADGVETGTGVFVSASDTGSNPLAVDTDGDTYPDFQEVLAGSNPNLNTSTPGANTPPLVNLDATVLPLGALTFWTNNGTVGGRFTNSAVVPNIVTVQGVKGVTFNGTDHFYTGPVAPAFIAGNGSRTVEAWIHNPAAAGEETVFAWGRRGGPDGSNASFIHGTSGQFGAIGHWGGGPDVPWGPDAPGITANLKVGRWTHVVYAYDGPSMTATVYADGAFAHSETFGSPLIVFALDNANRPLPFRVAAQNANNGNADGGGRRGSMTIAEVKVYDRALDGASVLASYNAGADEYGIIDYDNDGLPTWYERGYAFLNPNSAADAALDQDTDGLTNLQEYTNNTLPDNRDTDGDGVNDGPEVNRTAGTPPVAAPTNPLRPDTDGDGLTDLAETGTGTFVSASNTGSDPLLQDTDGDTYTDGQEVIHGSDPNLIGNIPVLTNAVVVVSLDATTLPLGPLNLWTNNGAMGGVFTSAGAQPSVQTIGNVKGVALAGAEHYLGPTAPVYLTGVNPRTVEAWLYNPAVADEETVIAWGARNITGPGPDGQNFSFGHGSNGGTAIGGGYGAVAMWGGPDIGWVNQEAAGRWQYCAATSDGTNTLVYLDGVQVNNETPAPAMNTRALDINNNPLPFRVGRQNSPTGGIDATGSPTLTIGKIRVYDQALSASMIASNYNAEVASFFPIVIQNFAVDNVTGAVTLSWNALTNQTYAVETSGTLTNWSNAGTGIATNTFSEIPGAGAGPFRYYRVRRE